VAALLHEAVHEAVRVRDYRVLHATDEQIHARPALEWRVVLQRRRYRAGCILTIEANGLASVLPITGALPSWRSS